MVKETVMIWIEVSNDVVKQSAVCKKKLYIFLNIRINSSSFYLTDICCVSRAFADPCSRSPEIKSHRTKGASSEQMLRAIADFADFPDSIIS